MYVSRLARKRIGKRRHISPHHPFTDCPDDLWRRRRYFLSYRRVRHQSVKSSRTKITQRLSDWGKGAMTRVGREREKEEWKESTNPIRNEMVFDAAAAEAGVVASLDSPSGAAAAASAAPIIIFTLYNIRIDMRAHSGESVCRFL